MPTKVHVCTTGQQYSFFDPDGNPDERIAIFQAFRYGDGPDAVLVTHGIQGGSYFRAIKEHFALISEGVRCVMGYVFERHVRIYERAMRGRAKVSVLFRGRPYGEDGPLMPWIMVEKIGSYQRKEK